MYLVEFNSNGITQTAYGKVVCYIVQEDVAYILLEQCKTTRRNICQDLPFPQDPVLKDIVEIHLIGEHYFQVKEDGEPLIASCHQIVNRGVYVKTREARGTITACGDSGVNFSGHEVLLGLFISFYSQGCICVDIFSLLRYTFLFDINLFIQLVRYQ